MTIRHSTLALLLPTVALAAEPTLLKSAGGIEEKRLHATASLSTSVGQATFVAHDDADNPTVAQSLSLGPSYSLTDKLTLGLGWSLGWEYTHPDNDTGRPYSPSDISGSISHSDIWSSEGLGLRLSGSLRAIAPTSFESRFARTVTNLTGSLNLSRAFLGDRLTLSYGPSVTKYLATRDTRPDVNCRFTPQGQAAEPCETPGMNNNFAHGHSLGVGYKFTDKLSGSLGITIRQRFKNATEGGSWTRQHSESTDGSLGVSYTLSETYSVSGGISSGQPALDGRSSRPRFPFADFETPANGYTTFGVTLSGRI